MDAVVEKRFKNAERSRTLRNIIRLFGLDKRAVLDIGCSYGEFLAQFGAGSTGVTLNPDEAAYARARGLDVVLGNIEEGVALQRTYDVVFANNIFEHLYSPHRFLCDARQYLTEGGVLILGVPCIPALSFLLRFRKFRGSLADAHINFFTRRTLVLTVQRAGWRVCATRGFRFSNVFADRLLDPMYPHFYIAARPDRAFSYSEKRRKELAGYGSVSRPQS